ENQKILVSPDGRLFQLPIDALIKNNKFIAENNNLSYTYSLLLNFLNQDLTDYTSNILLFAKSNHSDNLADLTFVRQEKEFIQSKFASHIFEEENASVHAFMNNLDEPSILHIATHAISNENETP